MPITLVQSVAGGSISSSGTGDATFVTTAAGFPAPTTLGNLIICIAWAHVQSTTGTPFASNSLQTPVTTGFSWVLQQAPFGWTINQLSNRESGYFYIAYIANAAVMNPATTTTVSSIVLDNGTAPYNIQVEFSLYEFAGAAPSPFDGKKTATGAGTTPNPGTITTSTVHDLIIAAYTGNPTGVNLSQNSGYVLGPNATVAIRGQAQYMLDAPVGANVTSFLGGINANWGAMAQAFKLATPVPILQVTPLTQAFAATEGGINPASQNIAVANGNGGTLNWTVASDQSWLTALPVSGTDAGVVAASVDITGLVAGVYTGHLTFTAIGATGSPQNTTVTLTITPAATALLVSPTALSFTGELGTGNPASQSATVSNTGTPGTMNFTLTTNQTWLTVTPTSGNAGITPVALTISTDVTGLAVGVYNATSTITATGAVGSPQNIIATITITAPPLPPPVILQSKALTQTDTWELDNGLEDWGTDTGTPFAWHETTLPQQQIAIAPTPDDVGQIGLLYIALARTLDGTGVALTVPDDWAPYIVWGVLSELLGSDGPSYDPIRAAYCERRFNEGIELARLVLGG